MSNTRTGPTSSIQDLTIINNSTAITGSGRAMARLSDLPDELLALIAEYLSFSRRDIHACVLLNHTLSSFFISYLWQNIDIFYCYPKEPELDLVSRFARFKAASIDTGALARHGRFIKSLRSVSADWLPFFGHGTCPLLESVDIGGYDTHVGTADRSPSPTSDEDDEAIVARSVKEGRAALATFLGQQASGTLRKLSLARNILWCRTEEEYLDLMRSIPQSVEELRLFQWDGSCFGEETDGSDWGQYIDIMDVQNFQDEYPRLRAAATAAAAALTTRPISTPSTGQKNILSNVKKLVLEYSIVDGAGPNKLLSWIPALESLSIYGSSVFHVVEFARTLRSRCPLLTALNISSANNKGIASLPGLAYPILLCASLRGWKTLALSSNRLVNSGTLWQTSLLHHVNTLETLYLEGFCMDNGGAFMGQLMDCSSRLKHLFVTPLKDYGMIWSKFSETSNWACRDLEVFRVPFIFIPYTSDIEAARNRFQQQLYHQLARLTKLRELIFGEMEDDELVLDNGDGYGDQQQPQYHQSSFSVNIRPQGSLVDDFFCPDMTIESGMDVLKDLRQLRRVGLRGLKSHAFLKSEEDQAWVKENWPLLQHEYRNDFWKVFRRW